MNSIVNRVQLIGRLGTDPEIKELDNDRKLAKLNLATNESYKNKKGEKITDTNWHNVVAWGKTAGILEKYTQKGSEIAIEGRLITRDYENKDGEKRYVTEVVANEVLLMSKPEK